MNKYDAILVLGRGIYRDGRLPESAKATIKKAVDLYNEGQSTFVIFSGKWSYRCEYIPPVTESESMANYAQKLGLPKSVIILEKDSYDTISNIYFTKVNILETRSFKRILLISVEIFSKRAFFTLKKILGKEYICNLIEADFYFPEQKRHNSREAEFLKYNTLESFFSNLDDGDSKNIFKAHLEYKKKHNI